MRGTYVKKTWAYDPTLYAPPRYRKACRYEAFIPEPLTGATFPLGSEVVGVVSDAEQAIMRLNSTAAPALAPLARLLLRTESIASSKVEGMQVGVRQIARAEARAETGGRVSSSVRDVLDNIAAMHVAVDEASSATRVTVRHLTNIHARLMEHARGAHAAGKVRTEQNWIGGNDYNPCGGDFVPPPPEQLDELLRDLCQSIATDSLAPLVQAALVHAQFETIHPFADGNGRAGRALIHVVLRRRGIAASYVPPISVVLANDRTGYVRGLTRFRSGEIEAWVEHFAAAAARAAGLATAYLVAVGEKIQEWRQQLRDGAAPRSDAAAWALIEILPAHPIITTPVALAASGRARAAVHQAVKQLEDSGVLVPLSHSKRNRAWEANGLLELLEGLEAGRPPGRS